MSYNYLDHAQDHTKYLTSRINEDKHYIYSVNNDPNYDTPDEALEKVKSYDRTFLPKLPTTGEITSETTTSNIITFKYYGASGYEIVNIKDYMAVIVPNTSDIGYGDPTEDTLVNCKASVQDIYDKADQVIITNPTTEGTEQFQPAVLANLLQNVNVAFSIGLPTSPGTYNYSKIKDSWIEQIS